MNRSDSAAKAADSEQLFETQKSRARVLNRVCRNSETVVTAAGCQPRALLPHLSAVRSWPFIEPSCLHVLARPRAAASAEHRLSVTSIRSTRRPLLETDMLRDHHMSRNIGDRPLTTPVLYRNRCHWDAGTRTGTGEKLSSQPERCTGTHECQFERPISAMSVFFMSDCPEWSLAVP